MEEEGFQVTYLPVSSTGLVSLSDIESAITPKTSLVSIMAVNNEIGVKQPIKEIGKAPNEKKTYFLLPYSLFKSIQFP